MSFADSHSSQTNIVSIDGERSSNSRSCSCCQNYFAKTSWKVILWKIINFIMFILFAVAAVYQWNDPDGHWWAIAYIIPCLFSLSIVVWITIQEYTIWKILIILHILGCLAGLIFIAVRHKEKLKKASPNIISVEEGWELCGLVIVVAWLMVMSIVASYSCIKNRFTAQSNSERTTSASVVFKQDSAFEPERLP